MEEGEMSDGADDSQSNRSKSRSSSLHSENGRRSESSSKEVINSDVKKVSRSRSRSQSDKGSQLHSPSRSRSGSHHSKSKHDKSKHSQSRSPSHDSRKGRLIGNSHHDSRSPSDLRRRESAGKRDRSRSYDDRRSHRSRSRRSHSRRSRSRRSHSRRSRSRGSRSGRSRSKRSRSRGSRSRRSRSGGSRSRRSRSRSSKSSRRRPVSDRERPTESRCLGVFGLSLYTGERELREYFGQYGSVESVQVVYDYHTGKSRGFAFIYMKHIEDAVEAKETAPGTEIDGHKIRVDYSVTQRAHTPTPGQYMGRTTGGYSNTRRMPFSKRTGHRSVSRSRSRSGSYSARRHY